MELGEFVILPNHVHGIIILNRTDEPCDGSVVDVETRPALSLHLEQSQQSQPPSLPQQNPQPKTIGQQRFQNQGKNTVSSIVGGYKSAVTRHAHRLGYPFAWQSRFHDHIIGDEGEYQFIAGYIKNNPSQWSDDKFFAK